MSLFGLIGLATTFITSTGWANLSANMDPPAGISLRGFESYLKVQKILSEAVAVIRGIAMDLTEEGCQMLSAQRLCGTGLCVRFLQQRNEMIYLINLREKRTGWPMLTMKENLYKEWQKIDRENGDRDMPVAI
ncbi:hypothetical protein BJ878DRAFT_476917 [Calycina marina]|uniref:ATP synthase protein MI25 n=1 Tax=Calycina marina TaxID=1763456 RepID=A0A9P7ZAN7_9HELO|nr:hypothetical protein BJ878DRAFT_476917 [Calycina marina]